VVDFLRDSVEDAATWRTEITELRARGKSPDNGERRAALGRLGDLLRVGGRTNEAIPALEQALHLARRAGDVRGVRANRVRLAIARQYANEHDAARAALEALVAEIDGDDDKAYLDYAVQHLGKVYAEREEWDRAVACLRRALDLRHGTPTATSSQTALNAALAARDHFGESTT